MQNDDGNRDRYADPRIYAQAAKQSMATLDYALDMSQFSFSREDNKPIPNDDVDTPIVVVDPIYKKNGDTKCRCNPCIQGPSCKC
jgi:hypothetical protein